MQLTPIWVSSVIHLSRSLMRLIPIAWSIEKTALWDNQGETSREKITRRLTFGPKPCLPNKKKTLFHFLCRLLYAARPWPTRIVYIPLSDITNGTRSGVNGLERKNQWSMDIAETPNYRQKTQLWIKTLYGEKTPGMEKFTNPNLENFFKNPKK